MIVDSYWKKRIVVMVLMGACVGLSYFSSEKDPFQETLLGQIGAYTSYIVVVLAVVYIYFFWKGLQERRQKK
jgi:hypothetical protein